MHVDMVQVWGPALGFAVAILKPLVLIYLLFFLAKYFYKQYEKDKLSKSGFNEIDQMDGLKFEKYLAALFENLGYSVRRTPYHNDYGADLIVSKDGQKIAVQVKRYRRNVGVKGIQEAVAACGKYHCQRAMVVTNSYFTEQAKELAKANSVDLWDRTKLERMMQHALDETNLDIRWFSEPAEMHDATRDTEMCQSSRDEKGWVCVVCGKHVSPRVRQYCLDRKPRFGGRVFCYDHQKGVPAKKLF